jgi:hypothetical protein
MKHMSEATIAALAIHLDTLMSCLGQHCMNPQTCASLNMMTNFQLSHFDVIKLGTGTILPPRS